MPAKPQSTPKNRFFTDLKKEERAVLRTEGQIKWPKPSPKTAHSHFDLIGFLTWARTEYRIQRKIRFFVEIFCNKPKFMWRKFTEMFRLGRLTSLDHPLKALDFQARQTATRGVKDKFWENCHNDPILQTQEESA